MAEIDYYFTSISPFTYLGNAEIHAIAKKHCATLNIKPSNIFALWGESGAVPPGQRPPVRQRQRLIELQRMGHFRSLPINTKPAHFPVDPTLCDCIIISLIENGEDAFPFMQAAFAAIWVEDKNVSDEATLAEILTAVGSDADTIIALANSDNIKAIRDKNSEDAIAADAPGVPSYVLNGECFFGQDRIEFLDDALSSGRAPFKAE